MLSKIKKIIPQKLKLKINILKTSSSNPFWIDKIYSNKKKVIVFLAAFYQNLGDMAITYAQINFLKSLLPDANLIVVPSNKTYEAVKTLKNYINSNDIVTITGGGNIDDKYTSLEDARLYVIKNFPNNRIISFPQTISFSNTKYGKKRQKISCKIYSKHNNLVMFTREVNSFEKVKKTFKNVKVELCPDMVLSLNKIEPLEEREGVICCLRSDCEQQISNDTKEYILKGLKNSFSNVIFTDTVDVKVEDCKPEKYEDTLENFWSMIRKSKLVVTDRLHCMIFCVITGTPCVAIDNINHKISGVYDTWLSDLSYIKVFSKIEGENILSECQKLYNNDFYIKKFDLTDKFIPLKDALVANEKN